MLIEFKEPIGLTFYIGFYVHKHQPKNLITSYLISDYKNSKRDLIKGSL